MRQARTGGAVRRPRNGFTLVELLVATILLVIVVTGSARFASNFSSNMSKSSIRLVASGIAAGRLELVRADPRYARLTTLYGGGAGADTTGFTGYPQMRRVTRVNRDQTGNPARDRTTVTVVVTDPGMAEPISITTVIASP